MEKFLCLFLVVCMFVSCKKNESDQVTQPSVVVYQDNLTVDQGKWPVDSNSVRVKKFYEGHYLIEVDSVPNVIAYSLAPYDSINYYYSVQLDATMQFSSSATSGFVGIIFNWIDNKNYYVTEVTGKGYYRIWQRIDGSITTIQTATLNSVIQTGNLAKNTIKIIQSADAVQLIINGTTIGSFDCKFPGVFVKVGLSTATGQNPVKGLFNNFILEKM